MRIFIFWVLIVQCSLGSRNLDRFQCMFNPPEMNVMQLHFVCAAHFRMCDRFCICLGFFSCFENNHVSLFNASLLVPGGYLLVTFGSQDKNFHPLGLSSSMQPWQQKFG